MDNALKRSQLKVSRKTDTTKTPRLTTKPTVIRAETVNLATSEPSQHNVVTVQAAIKMAPSYASAVVMPITHETFTADSTTNPVDIVVDKPSPPASQEDLSSKSEHIQGFSKRTLRKKAQGQIRLQRQAKQRQRHALTVDNILKELMGVSWKTLSFGRFVIGSGVLHLNCSQRQRIEKEYATEEARKQSAVEFFLNNHPYASWRLLISGLDEQKEHTVAKRLQRYAEKLTDPTLTLENLSKVMITLNEDILAGVLFVPVSKREEFQQQSSTKVDYRNKLMEYFLKYSHYTSWSDVSNHLYGWKQYEAVKAAKVFIKGTSEPTLTLHNLTTLLENVEHRWYDIGHYLNISRSKLNKIEQQHPSDHQRSRATWELYLTDIPQPSWKEVSRALYWQDHLDELELIQKKYLKGEL